MSSLTELEDRFLPAFRKMAADISAEFPKVRTNVWSYPVGALTDYNGQGLGVECSIPSNLVDPADPDQTEYVALMINLKHLATKPEIETVLVSWGSGQVETKLIPEPVAITEEALVEIENELPRLLEVLKSAVARGHPAAE